MIIRNVVSACVEQYGSSNTKRVKDSFTHSHFRASYQEDAFLKKYGPKTRRQWLLQQQVGGTSVHRG